MIATSLPVVLRTDSWARVRRFLSWWSGELADLAAARATTTRDWRVMFLRSERGCDVYLRARDRVEMIGTSPTGGDPPLADLLRRLARHKIAPGQIVLRLRPDEVVQTRLSVPAAAGEVLEAVIRNQIERLAPWPADILARYIGEHMLQHAEDDAAALNSKR